MDPRCHRNTLAFGLLALNVVVFRCCISPGLLPQCPKILGAALFFCLLKCSDIVWLLVPFFALLQMHPGARYESITPRSAKRNAFVLCMATRFVNSALRHFKGRMCAEGFPNLDYTVRIA